MNSNFNSTAKVIDMSESHVILKLEKPHFTATLYRSILRIDVKGNVKSEIEEALENKPVLKQTIGSILGIFAPLHVRLSDIDSVNADDKGKLKIVLPRHRDVTLPLDPEEARKLAGKLNDLIPEAKRREVIRASRETTHERIGEERLELGRASDTLPFVTRSYGEEALGIEEDVAEAEEKKEPQPED